ncbi:PREDICTED: uncharacterized protein LOC105313774 [Amphimedon queenslandica]|uniref:hAT-like transposase RNase-H fold domain-containing protein n=2 Tax=Amphimedon queenslandica TaxID=400682 RepID=A0AAN0IPW8_AMPQE|nr:PREDICTED: uncharacterized protein LOC105313774 [Amphimedon queenslandica]|eukprot:XP_011405772.1 PREDICTED: uncharacterized protein LOC105313774 [Amphimedon queenslandica]
MWTNRQMRSYFGMTAHFIVDFQLMSVMLACCRFSSSHTGEEMLEHYEDVKHAFGIKGKVDNIVTDNELEDTDDEDELQPVEDLSDDDLHFIKPNHYCCFAHTIQLVIKDGLVGADQVKRVLGKATKLVSHLRHSTFASELFEDIGRLQSGNVTWWNSQLTMLKSIVKVSDSTAMQQLDYNEILTPFKWATNLTQGQNVVIRGLRIEIDNFCQKFNSRFTTNLKASFEKQMFKYDNEEIFKIAAVLDPRWKMAWCSEDESVELKHILVQKVRSELHDLHATYLEETKTAPEMLPPPKKVSMLFEFMQARASVSTSQSDIDPIIHQLEEYISLPNLDEKEKPLFEKRKKLIIQN